MDRISQLPESIVHHILSFLNALHRSCPAELVRMSVLSKTWFHLTASFPLLCFSLHTFRSRESFFKYVEYTTSRFCRRNLPAHTLQLVTTLRDPADLDIVNGCLERVLNKGARELVIYLSDFTNSKYRLPNILLSVSMLESLIIRGCDLPSSLTFDAVKFKSLTRLVLRHIHIDDEVVKQLTISCPLLRQFHIQKCHGFKRFCDHGHQNLQSVSIDSNTQVERIDIKAPNLSTLSIIENDRSRPPQMNLASCNKLNTVTYFRRSLPNMNDFTDILSNFPFVEKIIFVDKYECNNLKLSSHCLNTLVLCSQCDLDEIEFNIPNLASFSYASILSRFSCMLKNARESWLRDSTHLKECMYCYPDGRKDTLWFEKLRKFLDKKNGFKVFNLYIHESFA